MLSDTLFQLQLFSHNLTRFSMSRCAADTINTLFTMARRKLARFLHKYAKLTLVSTQRGTSTKAQSRAQVCGVATTTPGCVPVGTDHVMEAGCVNNAADEVQVAPTTPCTCAGVDSTVPAVAPKHVVTPAYTARQANTAPRYVRACVHACVKIV